jgi:four helix bundle protein
MGDFRKLIGWQKAHVLEVAIHTGWRRRSGGEFTGLRGQLLRAAGSITDNLVEYCARQSDDDRRRHADHAYISSKEVESQLIKAKAVGALSPAEFASLAAQADEVCRICWTLSGRGKSR